MNTFKHHLGIRGEIKVDVLQGGIVVKEGEWQKNLILDRGLDMLATIAICDYFKVCIKGTGTTPTVEDVANTNTYTQAGTTVTRAAGTRDFSADDVGKLLQFDSATPSYGKVTAFTDTTHVEVDRTNAFTTKHMMVFAVDQDWTSITEQGVTAIAINSLTKPLSDDTVTVDGSPGTVFGSGDVGKVIYFNGSKAAFKITAFINADSVQVDLAGAPQGDVAISAETASLYTPISGDASLLSPSRTQTYSAVQGENKTYTGPQTASGDIPDLSLWQKQFKRTFVFPAETVLDSTNTYTEIMFSESEYPGDNINVHVILSSSVDVLGPTTGGDPAQQLKVTYRVTLSSTPHGITTDEDLSGITTESGGALSSNKIADHAIERFATSVVAPNGETNYDSTAMEPYNPAHAAVSKNTEALQPYANFERSNGVATKAMEAASYVGGSFANTYQGTFELNDAIGAYRCFMLYDIDASMGVHTYLFDAPQNKDGNHILRLTFSKTWDRDLN